MCTCTADKYVADELNGDPCYFSALKKLLICDKLRLDGQKLPNGAIMRSGNIKGTCNVGDNIDCDDIAC